MGFKFQFGDQVYVVDSNKMSTWTRIRTGAVGTVDMIKYEHDKDTNPVIVRLRFAADDLPKVWWVYESEIEFVNRSISVDASSLLQRSLS